MRFEQQATSLKPVLRPNRHRETSFHPSRTTILIITNNVTVAGTTITKKNIIAILLISNIMTVYHFYCHNWLDLHYNMVIMTSISVDRSTGA